MIHSPLLNEAKAAEYLGVSPKTLSGWRWAGKGPVYRKLESAVRYVIADLDEFLAKGRVARHGQ